MYLGNHLLTKRGRYSTDTLTWEPVDDAIPLHYEVEGQHM